MSIPPNGRGIRPPHLEAHMIHKMSSALTLERLFELSVTLLNHAVFVKVRVATLEYGHNVVVSTNNGFQGPRLGSANVG